MQMCSRCLSAGIWNGAIWQPRRNDSVAIQEVLARPLWTKLLGLPIPPGSLEHLERAVKVGLSNRSGAYLHQLLHSDHAAAAKTAAEGFRSDPERPFWTLAIAVAAARAGDS